MTEEELRRWAHPTATDILLKSSFWSGIRLAWARGVELDSKDIYEGICSYTHYYANFLKNPYKLAWLIRPIIDSRSESHALKNMIVDRLREVLLLPIQDDEGALKPKNINEIIKVAGLFFDIQK